MYSEEYKNRIIETAITLFNSKGCKNVTMDQIAQTLHISKRSMYEIFDSKEALMLECLAHVHRIMGEERVKRIKLTDETFLIMLYIISSETSQNMYYARILQDAEQYYPELTKKLLKDISPRFKEVVTNIFNEAQKNGDLRRGVDIPTAVNMIEYYIHQPMYIKKESDDLFQGRLRDICYTYLRGMLSIEAIKRYDANEDKFKQLLSEQQN